MKNLFKNIICLVILFSFASCGDDNEKSLTTLEGTWTAIEFSADVSLITELPGQSLEVTSNLEAENLNYDLTLDGTNFTTEGSYDINGTSSTSLTGTQNVSDSYTNVSGSGTYTTTDTEITLSNSFYDLELDGMPVSAFSQPQTANYEINSDGELVITQNINMETDTGVGNLVSDIRSSSVWVRK